MIDKDQLANDGEIDDVRLDEGDEPIENHEESDGDGKDEVRAETEARARDLGWKPKAEWKGDQTTWEDAEAFVTKHKPTRLRETIDRQAKEIADLKRERDADKRS